MSSATTLAVDVGGTFTDAVVTTPGGRFTAKTPTTPDDQSLGVMRAATDALGAAGVEPRSVASFVHGMTVTTNALLEARFVRTALLATAGFTDVEQLGRQNRADLYRLERSRPAPIVPDELRLAIDERCGPDGVITPFDREQAARQIARAAELGAEALAVCLLFSFRHPEHELELRELAGELAPQLHISLSHQAVGTFREYERCATTIADAALGPLLAGYLERLTARAAEAGLPAPEVMLSSGGTVPAAVAGHNASWTVLSGPAGGTVGAARTAVQHGAERAVAFDMGGTSTDVSLVADGVVAVTADREIGGRPVALPAVDVSTVGAGGGSIAWRDGGGALRVGPRSAGARPGPAAYGHGGTEPTVTDANLLLGRLGSDSALAGGLKLDRAAAERALATLGETLGLNTLETAAGVIEIANLEMLRAINAITVARGIDPRDHALIAFGGAGPMHAAEVAEALGVGTVICPAASGVLSAWGIGVAGRRRDRSRSLVRPLTELSEDDLAEIERELAEAARAELGTSAEAVFATTWELRYSGQAFELPVSAERSELAGAFHAAHRERFGFAETTTAVELVTVRVSATAAAATTREHAANTAHGSERSSRSAWFAGEQYETQVFSGAAPSEQATSGPLLIEQDEATIVVPPGWSARGAGDDVVLEREPS